MATSWMIVDQDGERRPVEVRARTGKGVKAAVRRAQGNGQTVLAAYLGGPYAIAMAPRVCPPSRPA